MNVIACMSGTSLDGLDIAFCRFTEKNSIYQFDLVHSYTYSYDKNLRNRLASSDQFSALNFIKLDNDLACFFADRIQKFIDDYNIKDVDYVASHGQTIFHQPKNLLTKQIGNGLLMAQKLNIPVVYNFRSLDVYNGGQGAPLVPIGDQLLFSDYDYCLNIGGFSNISYNINNQRIAYDISPVNIVLNTLSKKLGKDYDKGGSIAFSGNIIPELLDQLNQLEYYQQKFPKSLGKEWVNKYIVPLLNKYINTVDVIRTYTEHSANQISNVLKGDKTKTLVTGGGAYNTFLMECIKKSSESNIIVPEGKIVEFKEALIFGLLAYLRVQKKINILSSVTGACKDSSSGLIAYP